MSISKNTSKLKSGFSKSQELMYSVFNDIRILKNERYELTFIDTPICYTLANKIGNNVRLNNTFFPIRDFLYPQLNIDYYIEKYISQSIKSNLLKNIIQ